MRNRRQDMTAREVGLVLSHDSELNLFSNGSGGMQPGCDGFDACPLTPSRPTLPCPTIRSSPVVSVDLHLGDPALLQLPSPPLPSMLSPVVCVGLHLGLQLGLELELLQLQLVQPLGLLGVEQRDPILDHARCFLREGTEEAGGGFRYGHYAALPVGQGGRGTMHCFLMDGGRESISYRQLVAIPGREGRRGSIRQGRWSELFHHVHVHCFSVWAASE